MDIFNRVFTSYDVWDWQTLADDWIFVAAMAVLAIELARTALRRALSWTLVGDSVTNFITFGAFVGIYFVLGGALYTTIYYFFYEAFSLTQIPITIGTVLLCVVLADLAYYWEHRFAHRVGIAWASHTVHHSSPFFNISVAYRFGPLDGLIPLPFHIPLVIIGFNPFVVFFAELVVQLYQTLLHTELVRKLPRPIEAVMNTPSHHRVHHGRNDQYLDKNYGGIFIIWDRIFGTFAEEQEPVRYGIRDPLNSVNPFTVFFHGLTRLARRMIAAKGVRAKLGYAVRPPGWSPQRAARPSPD